jgi:hypothetical protein
VKVPARPGESVADVERIVSSRDLPHGVTATVEVQCVRGAW